ncbi:hypothetical protein P886_3334 [Alteromonadaceae bacterium 2753L.S.0a.02]|nr:hypothetical protein P886_3334 [Alteromonadaceae bacterium 2753L.S.0a.02]
MMSIRLLSAQTFFQFVLVLLVTVGVAACGGGGGNSSAKPTAVPTSEPTPTPEPDTTPADFTLSLPQTTYERGAVATTEQVTITDIDTLTDISISSGGEYSIDSGSFTSSAGQIANNQTVVARATAGGNFDDEVAITLTVGTLAKSFTVVTEAQDITPEAFSFTALNNVGLSSEAVSTAATITGINDAAPISISGGEYSIAGGSYTSTAGSVTDGQAVTVRLTSSSAFSTQSTATLNVGGVEASFSVTTLAQDITPDEFSFTAVTDADFNTQYTSETVTISGINDATPISVVGGEYSINTGAYTSDAGMIANGDTVSVRLTSATSGSTAAVSTLNVGGVEGGFSVTTIEDSTLPVVQLYFPTQLGITDKATLRVRGVATDDMSGVSSVSVNGVVAETSDGFANWQATIDLAQGENDITLIAQDGSGNTTASQVFATITRSDDLSAAFNVEDATMDRFYGLEYIPSREKFFVVEDRRNYYFLDPETGAFTLVSEATDPVNHDIDANGRSLTSTYYDIEGEEGVFVGGTRGIYHVNLDNGERTMLTDASVDDASLAFDQIYRMGLVQGDTLAESYLLVSNRLSNSLVKVDLVTGQKVLFSDNLNLNFGEPIQGSIDGLEISNQQSIVYLTTSSSVYSVDTVNEGRIEIAQSNLPDMVNTPFDAVALLGDDSELCGTSLDTGVEFLSCVGLSDASGNIRRALSEADAPQLTDQNEATHLAARDLLYTCYTDGVGVTDMVSGETLVLLKVAN